MNISEYMKQFTGIGMTLAEYKEAILLTTKMSELDFLAKRAFQQDDRAMSSRPTLYNEVVALCYRRADQLGNGNRLGGKRAVVNNHGNARHGIIIASLSPKGTKSSGTHGQTASIYMDDTHRVEDFQYDWAVE